MPRVRLTVAYNPPADPAAFLDHYAKVHEPLVREIPGLASFEWSKVIGTPTGDTPRYFVLAELTFASMDAFGAGLGSPEGQATAADVGNFAPDGAEMFISELA